MTRNPTFHLCFETSNLRVEHQLHLSFHLQYTGTLFVVLARASTDVVLFFDRGLVLEINY